MLTSRATFTRGQNITAGGDSWISHFSVSVAHSHVAGNGQLVGSMKNETDVTKMMRKNEWIN